MFKVDCLIMDGMLFQDLAPAYLIDTTSAMLQSILNYRRNHWIHAKIMIRDNKVALIFGSSDIHLSKSSF